MRDTKVYSIIVSYNGVKWLRTCLNSLVNSSMPNDIIVVDNHSSDESIELIEKEFSKVVLLKQHENLGFGKANNIGISYALQQGAEYVFLLNQDACIEENALEKLVLVSKENSDFGILSPLQLNWDGTRLEHYFARFVGENNQFYSDAVLKKPMKQLYEVPFVNAAAWLVPKKTFVKIGGFDPVFYHYGEDNNFCQRVLFHGFKIGVVPATFIYHDAKVRIAGQIPLFSEAYYLEEIKSSLIKYADINHQFTLNEIKKQQNHMLKLMVVNCLKGKPSHVIGYYKKQRLFKKVIQDIIKSRNLNKIVGAHYLKIEQHVD